MENNSSEVQNQVELLATKFEELAARFSELAEASPKNHSTQFIYSGLSRYFSAKAEGCSPQISRSDLAGLFRGSQSKKESIVWTPLTQKEIDQLKTELFAEITIPTLFWGLRASNFFHLENLVCPIKKPGIGTEIVSLEKMAGRLEYRSNIVSEGLEKALQEHIKKLIEEKERRAAQAARDKENARRIKLG